jgi:hypothetical protein
MGKNFCKRASIRSGDSALPCSAAIDAVSLYCSYCP